MATERERFEEIVSRLVNALQTAVVLAERLTQQAADATALREAVERAAAAARELRPDGETLK